MGRYMKKIVAFLAVGSRPVRILVFGGIVLAWLLLKLLGQLFGVDTAMADGIRFDAVLLLMASIVGGFGISIAVFSHLTKVRGEDAAHDDR